MSMHSAPISLIELEQSDFDAKRFLEMLAFKAAGGTSMSDVEQFDPMMIHQSFKKMLTTLNDKNNQLQTELNELEKDAKQEEQNQLVELKNLMNKNAESFLLFEKLDTKISNVSNKVVHIGDQLESVNVPRSRIAEAKNVMLHLREFIINTNEKSAGWQNTFNDPKKWHLRALLIQKLSSICNEIGDMPNSKNQANFFKAKAEIQLKQSEIEQQLIQQFLTYQFNGRKKEMRRIAIMMANFPNYNKCTDKFIEHIVKLPIMNVFEQVPLLCSKVNEEICDIFPNPEAVMTRFIIALYDRQVFPYVKNRIDIALKKSLHSYLVELEIMYVSVGKLNKKLEIYKLGNDPNMLEKLKINAFNKPYLEAYINKEYECLKEKCKNFNRKFYEEKNHQKKAISVGGFSEFRRDFQEIIGTNLEKIENYGGETFLDNSLAANLIQETKSAINRCNTLSIYEENLPSQVKQLFYILTQQLCEEHVMYAVLLGLQTIPLSDQKIQPNIYFFHIVRDVNAIFTLFEKFFTDIIVPKIRTELPIHSSCIGRKNDVKTIIESKLDDGIKKSLNCICGWVKTLLVNEQKKSDYRPGNNTELQSTGCTLACMKVKDYMQMEIIKINSCLDGDNLHLTLQEMGFQFHGVVYDHIMQFYYDNAGAMMLLCDISAYRNLCKSFKSDMVDKLFMGLYHLANLLICSPDHFNDMISDNNELAPLKKRTIFDFLQRRADYNQIKDNLKITALRN